MLLHYHQDDDALELVLSEPHDPDRVESIDVMPSIQVVCTPPKEHPPKGFKITDPDKYRANVMIHRIRIQDITLHATGEHPQELCSLFVSMHDLMQRLDELADRWRDEPGAFAVCSEIKSLVGDAAER